MFNGVEDRIRTHEDLRHEVLNFTSLTRLDAVGKYAYIYVKGPFRGLKIFVEGERREKASSELLPSAET